MWSISLHFFTQRGQWLKFSAGDWDNLNSFSITTAIELPRKYVWMCWRFFFLYSSFTGWFVQSLDRQQGKRASIMQQNESQYIHEWIWVRCLKVYKNNGVCNIIPGTPNGSSLKGGISNIRRLHSSVHSRGRGVGGGGYLRRETCSQV